MPPLRGARLVAEGGHHIEQLGRLRAGPNWHVDHAAGQRVRRINVLEALAWVRGVGPLQLAFRRWPGVMFAGSPAMLNGKYSR